MIYFSIKDAVIQEANEKDGYQYKIVHPEHTTIIAFATTAEEANEVVRELDWLGKHFERRK